MRACEVGLVNYIICSECEAPLIRDDFHEHRQALEVQWGDPTAGNWTVELQCPTCASYVADRCKKLERENSILHAALLDEFVERTWAHEPDLPGDEVQIRAEEWLLALLRDDTEEDGE